MTLVDLFRLPFMKMILNFSGRHMGAKLYQKRLGVCHGDDLFYLFPFSIHGFPTALKTEADRITSRHLLELWANMAKAGQPTPPEAKAGVAWEAWGPNPPFSHLRIGSGLSMETDPTLARRIDFWNGVTEVNARKGLSDKPVSRIYSAIAEKRHLVTDPTQLFS